MQSDSISSSPQNECHMVRIRWHAWKLTRVICLSFLLATLGTTGCRLFRPCYQHSVAVSPSTQKKVLAPSDPQQVDLISIPSLPDSEKGLIPDGFKQVFPLTIEECERLAAQHSPIASVLEMESNQSGACQPCSTVDPCVLNSVNTIIAGNAAYQRNVASEKALLAYLGLVEVYLQNQLLAETIAEIDELQSVLDRLQKEGLLRQVDPEILSRKKIEALEKRNELLFNFEQLNESLRLLLGLESSVHPIWTACVIPQWQVPTEITAEIAAAMENRTDLQSIQNLSNVSNDQILNTLRSSVRSISPFAGLVLERRLFGGFFADNSAEIAKLRSQLTVLHATQMDLVRSQVSTNFYSMFKSKEQIELKLQKLASLRKSEARLDAKRQVGPIEVDEVLAIKSELLSCRSEVIHAVIELQMSWVRLKSAQGLLGQSSGTSSTQSSIQSSSPRTAPSLDGAEENEVEVLGGQAQNNASRRVGAARLPRRQAYSSAPIQDRMNYRPR